MPAALKEETTVLVVDDDPAVVTVLVSQLEQAGLHAVGTHSARAALDALESSGADVVITDLRMPEMSGMALLEQVKKRFGDLPVIVLTAHGSIPDAVEAMRRGASNFLLKPFDRQEVLRAVEKAVSEAARTARHPPDRPLPEATPDELARAAGPAARLDALVTRAASSPATVLITGETGTGKEVAARAIHRQSARARAPFVVVHCAALPENLLESELFGYERGAFTGATTTKPGRVELAEGGTLFLDEIGEVAPSVQVKLLRLVQQREYERLGGTRTHVADVRFVAATHRDLSAMVETGAFREDLFYRLNVLPIRVPALRDRPEDIPDLIASFWERLVRDNGRTPLALAPETVEGLATRRWPGNVRELENYLERIVVFADGPVVTPDDLTGIDALALGSSPVAGSAPSAETPHATPDAAGAPAPERLDERLRDAERAALETALQRCVNNRTQAARLLGISRRTLYNKLAEHGLS